MRITTKLLLAIVLCVALALPTFTAPVDSEGLAARSTDKILEARQRRVGAKAPAARRPPVKTVAKRPVAKAPATRKVAAKAPVGKAAVKKVAAKKAAVKKVAAKKAVAKKAPVKKVAAKKAVAKKAPAKKVAKKATFCPNFNAKGPLPKDPNAKSAAPKKAAGRAKRSLVERGDIFARAVSTTQFHATCKNFAASIKALTSRGALTLQPERLFPNEFTWSGGFYVTPDEGKAQLFGAIFLAAKCASLGGVEIMKFTLDTSALNIKEVATADVNKFRGDQSRLGSAIKRILKRQAPSEAAPDPPTDANISKDDNPAVAAPEVPIPTEAEVQALLDAKDKGFVKLSESVAAFASMKGVDIVAGAGVFSPPQRVTIADASNPAVGMPPLREPFNQVVLVTDKATQALRFVSSEPLQQCLAEKQPALIAFLKKKGSTG